MRNSLQKLADDMERAVGSMGYRVFVDSGPVLEKALARNGGLGWIGKHTNLIARDAGSCFFIGEILTDLPLPADEAASAHCGSCEACIPACPTGAIVAPYRLDARRCISYLTIEPGRDSRRAAPRSATASTAATIASWCVRGTSSHATPRIRTSRRGTGWMHRNSAISWPGPKRSSCSAARLRDLSHWLRALAAQHRGGARQCADFARECDGARRARGRRVRTRAGARAMGAHRNCGPRRPGSRRLATSDTSGRAHLCVRLPDRRIPRAYGNSETPIPQGLPQRRRR